MIQKQNNSRRFNFKKLLKKDIEWLDSHYCKHSKSYIEHPSCYWVEAPDTSPIKEKIGFLDIECANLDAPYGFIISWCIKEQGGGLTGAHVRAEDIERERTGNLKTKVKTDEWILRQFIKEVKRYDKLVVFFGKNRRFDIPFLRHRCIKLGLQFPLYGEVFCVDMYDWAKNYLKMGWHKNSLALVCNELGIPAKGTKCPAYYWIKATQGNMAAIKTIYEHNKDDVICLEPLYELLEPYSRRMRTSA